MAVLVALDGVSGSGEDFVIEGGVGDEEGDGDESLEDGAKDWEAGGAPGLERGLTLLDGERWEGGGVSGEKEGAGGGREQSKRERSRLEVFLRRCSVSKLAEKRTTRESRRSRAFEVGERGQRTGERDELKRSSTASIDPGRSLNWVLTKVLTAGTNSELLRHDAAKEGAYRDPSCPPKPSPPVPTPPRRCAPGRQRRRLRRVLDAVQG